MRTIICSLILFSVLLDAQTYLNIRFTDGSDQNAPLSSITKLTFSPLGGQISFFISDSAVINRSLSSIQRFTFGNTGAGTSILAKTLKLTALLEGFYNPSTGKQVMDSITVSLRNMNDFSLVESTVSVADSFGFALCKFTKAAENTSYYLVLNQRNRIETWSDSSMKALTKFSSSSMTYDFSSDSAMAFGKNMIKMGTKWCLYGGDVNQDGVVDISDMVFVDNDSYNFAGGYISTDINGDGTADITDMVYVDNNSYNFVGVQKPGTKNSTRPVSITHLPKQIKISGK